jgi:hypothetical protein
MLHACKYNAIVLTKLRGQVCHQVAVKLHRDPRRGADDARRLAAPHVDQRGKFGGGDGLDPKLRTKILVPTPILQDERRRGRTPSAVPSALIAEAFAFEADLAILLPEAVPFKAAQFRRWLASPVPVQLERLDIPVVCTKV